MSSSITLRHNMETTFHTFLEKLEGFEKLINIMWNIFISTSYLSTSKKNLSQEPKLEHFL